jgi:sialate O-acetylesterase
VRPPGGSGIIGPLAARGIAYKEPIEYSGPIYESHTVDPQEPDRIVISFTHIGGGLVTRDGGALTGFAIAGDDGKFVNAQAEIRGDQVVVWSPQIASPVAVRYAWANFPICNLWNKAGLPASPFRTDDTQLSWPKNWP